MILISTLFRWTGVQPWLHPLHSLHPGLSLKPDGVREEPEASPDGGSQGGPGGGGDVKEPYCCCNGEREQAAQAVAEAAGGGGGGQREEEGGEPALPKLEHVQTVRGGPAAKCQ